MADVAGIVRFAEGNIAAPWWMNGCAVIPIKPDGSKAPYFSWKPYQDSPPDAEKVQEWWEVTYPTAGVAVICGAASQGLEMLELEGRAYSADFMQRINQAAIALGIEDLWATLLERGYTEMSPSGGLHLLYRVTDHVIPGNTRVAARYAVVGEYNAQELEHLKVNAEARFTRVLAETRGQGGYVIVAPSSGACHPSGRPWTARTGTADNILNISWGDRELVHQAIRNALNEVNTELAELPAIQQRPPRPAVTPGLLSPGDDFERRHSWEEPWFMNAGWTVHHRAGSETYWTRPGKSEGISATTGFVDGVDRLYIFTTSTDLPVETPLNKFFIHSHYSFNGSMSDCARSLRAQGYGTPFITPTEFGEIDFGQEGDEPADNAPAARTPHALGSRDMTHRPDGGIVFTDIGYARRMHDKYRERIRYNSIEKAWYLWRPGSSAWTRDDTGHVDTVTESVIGESLLYMDSALMQANEDNRKRVEALYKKAREAASNMKVSSVLNRFRAQDGIAVGPESFDSNLDLLNLQNCTFNLATNEVTAHDPANMITMTFDANYNPEAQCPRWLQFVEEVFPDENIRKYVQRALGYSLTGRPTKRVMFLLHGPSGTGKSVLTSVVTQLFGDYGATAPATTFRLKKNETTVDVHQLRGKRFVSTSEMPEGAQLDEELVKRMTGGDAIRSRALYESFHEWRARCVIWIATNFLPRLSSDDNAIWRRAKAVPMRTEFGPHSNKQEIEGLADQLLQERDGIFNWLLDGLAEYREVGLAEPAVITAGIRAYRVDTDSVASWLQEEIDTGAIAINYDGRVASQLLYQRYVSHCQTEGTQPLGHLRFSKRLSTVDFKLESKKIGGARVWCGLQFNGEFAR